MAECKRHRYQVTDAYPIEKKGPTGHRSGFWGMWELRACVKCEAGADSRYAPGINERSAEAARRAYGVSAVDQQTFSRQTPMGG